MTRSVPVLTLINSHICQITLTLVSKTKLNEHKCFLKFNIYKHKERLRLKKIKNKCPLKATQQTSGADR